MCQMNFLSTLVCIENENCFNRYRKNPNHICARKIRDSESRGGKFTYVSCGHSHFRSPRNTRALGCTENETCDVVYRPASTGTVSTRLRWFTFSCLANLLHQNDDDNFVKPSTKTKSAEVSDTPKKKKTRIWGCR